MKEIKAWHTSLNDFDQFDARHIGSSTGHTGICAGFFFSLDRAHSSHMAEGSDGWITYEVALTVTNPATAKDSDEAFEKWGDGQDAVNALTAAGHDALILAGGDEIVVWDTNKIQIVRKS